MLEVASYNNSNKRQLQGYYFCVLKLFSYFSYLKKKNKKDKKKKEKKYLTKLKTKYPMTHMTLTSFLDVTLTFVAVMYGISLASNVWVTDRGHLCQRRVLSLPLSLSLSLSLSFCLSFLYGTKQKTTWIVGVIGDTEHGCSITQFVRKREEKSTLKWGPIYRPSQGQSLLL